MMNGRRRQRDSERAFLPANERFKRGYGNRVLAAIVISAGLHYLLFAYFPVLQAADLGSFEEGISVVELPPEVRIPPPPEQIARPATPRITEEPMREDVTIAPTTFEENPVDELPPPPPQTADVRDRPVYIARDVEPRLKNTRKIRELLRRLYPPMLREAGIGGTVVLWVFVEPDGTAGRTRVQTSSGYPPLDRTAEQIARQMFFFPAMSRDKPVGVWIAQPIRFTVRTG
jgi:TonB family protein